MVVPGTEITDDHTLAAELSHLWPFWRYLHHAVMVAMVASPLEEVVLEALAAAVLAVAEQAEAGNCVNL